ncbi:conserved hypothetical protein [Xenorhabdus nematophila F1]|uniref:Uncharacterized protein n=1 Tax=Xenorhabdus nematophila (strain ATCC 19061 / DSM 3370 / CCUG 14189 / LMG 1036 / NCIMB 9965 / AN6) TaxID=406817 RepID=D3VGN4_XENNA|nr:hypothetical protein XNC1_2411 [Xenorhabdus nematophila ATCC 19061]CCW32496.1 conserved hypothetical protein [Xenorhabdus nematophila F1]CEE92807.1 hypothetical protein XNA1_3100011 [Xenorhabdus nematophila str. Anatoliense]CEF32891.1 hypothetical protein XNW1_4550003 [Xenorhabdus nematophila str. Websteri]CEK23312.1 hypothetical protein XNC2_2318 [Xenorhabdus nematophila AN6/1]
MNKSARNLIIDAINAVSLPVHYIGIAHHVVHGIRLNPFGVWMVSDVVTFIDTMHGQFTITKMSGYKKLL